MTTTLKAQGAGIALSDHTKATLTFLLNELQRAHEVLDIIIDLERDLSPTQRLAELAHTPVALAVDELALLLGVDVDVLS